MGFREADAVIAMYDLTSTVTGGSVRCGDEGVILKQVGISPATFKVRFTVADPVGGTVVLDGVTDRDLARPEMQFADAADADRYRNDKGLRRNP